MVTPWSPWHTQFAFCAQSFSLYPMTMPNAYVFIRRSIREAEILTQCRSRRGQHLRQSAPNPTSQQSARICSSHVVYTIDQFFASEEAIRWGDKFW